MRRTPTIALVAAVLMLLTSGMIAAPRAAAEQLGVTAWITIGNTAPAVGCIVPVSIEIRSNGYAVSQTAVAAAMHIDSDFLSIDREQTDGNGIAYLSLDTSRLGVGQGAWVDITVGDQYFTGFAVTGTSDGACSGSGKMLTVTGTATASSSTASGFPTHLQERNLSCEFAAVQIATAAWGNAISEYSLDNVVGWSPNPHWGYRGNIHGWWGNTDDYGVYAEALAAALPSFGYSGYVFYGQGDATQLIAELDAGIPTIVWLGMWGDQSHYEQLDGVSYKLIAGMHVMVAYDYDNSGVYLSDPGTGTLKFYTWGDFMYMWNVVDGMALGISPA